LIQTGTNNPVILFDELDKVSQTDKGQEIIGVLTHLTDTTQNEEFHDDYFSEIHLDMSKALIVCSYNDESLVNPILKDRMYTIDIPGYTTTDKICIAKQHLIPEIEKDLGVKTNSFIIQDSALKYLIERTHKEDGVRNLKRNLETIYSKLNLFSILKETTIFNDIIEVKFPFEINESIINSLIKIQIQKHNPMYI
jgi:ATP-dependent Lon protease